MRLAGWLEQFLRPRRWGRRPAAGVYLWGGVGRGKSFVMDRFFEAAPLKAKRRVHFHAFLQEVQVRMRHVAGQPDPLLRVAEALAGEVQLLCFDEFHVHDMGDARLLGRLLEGLIEAGVGLVCTSNYAPSALCPNPLYRERFKPTIALIERHFNVIEVDGGEDYRLRAQPKNAWGRFHRVADDAWLPAAAPGLVQAPLYEVDHRPLRLAAVQGEQAWADVDTLLRQPRASRDYLWLSQTFARLHIGVLPPLEGEGIDVLQRLVNLIDILYDAGTRLDLYATAPLERILRPALHPDLERTLSRLAQLQAVEPST